MGEKKTVGMSQPARRKAALITDQLTGSTGGETSGISDGLPPAGGAMVARPTLHRASLLLPAAGIAAFLVWRAKKHR